MNKSKITSYIKQGVIHVGAYVGEEREQYGNNVNVFWIEPNEVIFKTLEQNIKSYPKQKALCVAITTEDEVTRKLHVAKQADRSSLYNFTQHHFKEKKFQVEGVMEVKCKRLDVLFSENSIDISQYNVLVTDCQGGDYDVLISAGEYIRHFDAIQVEVMRKPIYKNIALENSINTYMKKMGFRHMNPNDPYKVQNTQRDNLYVNVNT